MPETDPVRQDDRAAAIDREADHAEIARLADELLPALIAKLATTRLGELEVREGGWKIRLRRPFGAGPGEGRRAGDRPSRSQPGHEGHGHPRATPEPHRVARPGGDGAGRGAAHESGHGHDHAVSGNGSSPGNRDRSVATSPAVGTFRPSGRVAVGTRVRAGDTVGIVDVLGVPQEVTAPVDGIVGATLVEAGMAVEYGQELVRIELSASAAPGGGAPAEAR